MKKNKEFGHNANGHKHETTGQQKQAQNAGDCECNGQKAHKVESHKEKLTTHKAANEKHEHSANKWNNKGKDKIQGFFAPLRMTAEKKGNDNSRFPSGMTSKRTRQTLRHLLLCARYRDRSASLFPLYPLLLRRRNQSPHLAQSFDTKHIIYCYIGPRDYPTAA